MDPATIAALINGGSKILSGALGQPATAPTAPQRADGYALGGMASGGATGGAYGGAFSQANIDGSNWIVATGKSSAWADSLKSGGNGGLSPTQTMTGPGGVNPSSPFLSQQGMTLSPMVLIGIGLAVILIMKR